ncbi:MAG: hypothetical protein H0X39_00920 [Actinobacteria bacterium]|nr:hypothetical protein [Actinomycetota bacterium]
MSILETIAHFSTAAADGTPSGYVVTRTPAGTYVNGRYTAGTPTTFTIDAVVQPGSGRDLKVMAEGQFSEDTKVLWTTTALVTMSPVDVPDTLVIAGDTYSVASVIGPWNMSGVTFYKVSVARQRVP